MKETGVTTVATKWIQEPLSGPKVVMSSTGPLPGWIYARPQSLTIAVDSHCPAETCFFFNYLRMELKKYPHMAPPSACFPVHSLLCEYNVRSYHLACLWEGNTSRALTWEWELVSSAANSNLIMEPCSMNYVIVIANTLVLPICQTVSKAFIPINSTNHQPPLWSGCCYDPCFTVEEMEAQCVFLKLVQGDIAN